MKTNNRFISTIELIGKLHAEPKSVKQSVGGIKSFRNIMAFVQSNARYEDADNCVIIERKASEIASLLEKKFSEEEINEVKSLYII